MRRFQKRKTFIKTGFSKWKVAMEKGKGFKKHEQSEIHKRAMASPKYTSPEVQNEVIETLAEIVLKSARKQSCFFYFDDGWDQ